MNEEQKVEITLGEYLKLKEMSEHSKEVRISEEVIHKKPGCDEVFLGTTIRWKSDGACWLHLGNKLTRSGEIIKDKVKQIEKLEKDLEEYDKIKKEGIVGLMQWRYSKGKYSV